LPQRKAKKFFDDWEGYYAHRVIRCGGDEKSSKPLVIVELLPRNSSKLFCNRCGRVCKEHDRVVRWIRDLPIFEVATLLKLYRRRVYCPKCGPQLERLDWLERYSRVTRRLAESVSRLCQHLPVKQVAEFYQLSWDQVKAIDKQSLKQRFDRVELSDVKLIVLDEFALHKGHRYATVVVEPGSKRVLWVGSGHSRASLRPFFKQLGQTGCRRLQAVAMDMNGAYEQEVRAHCPKARIVFDLFHVIAKYSREVINRVRINETHRLKHDPSGRRLIKGSRWLLLRNPENISRQQDRIRLEELLAANHNLLTVYLLKDDLKQLWSLRSAWKARRLWKQWQARAMESGLAPLIKFAQRLRPYISGIIAHCRWPLHTSLLEGINNKIKVIKRMVYGFRDSEYFFLKIKAAFPGNPG